MNRRRLEASSALPLLFAAFGGMLAASPGLAACITTGAITNCDAATPDPWIATVGTGRGDHNRTVNVLTGASIQVLNRNAISLGDNARITLRSGSLVRTDATSGHGQFVTGPQPIEFNSSGILVIEEGARLIERGTQAQAEAVNVHGVGNRIENHGLISGQSSAAIWFQDEIKTSPKNVVDNHGIIEQVNGATVIGTSGGSGIDFYNQSGAVVKGGLSFANGDDNLFFFAGSAVTGGINGGGGNNHLTLEGALGTSDELEGALANFRSLTKDGLGRWTITGTLSGFQSTTVNRGTLALTGDNTDYSAGVLINPLGTLEARAQSLPVESDPASNVNNIRNNGLLRFAQPVEGTYVGQIVGTGRVEKTGAGVVTLAPSAAAGNIYAGGTIVNEGTLAVAADNALGAATGGLTFDGGTLRTTATFSTARAATLLPGGGTFEPTAGTLTETGAISGAGRLTKIGAGTLALTGSNTYAGGTQINAGAVQVSTDANLGGAAGPLGFDGGTLRSTASFSTVRATTLGTNGGTFETAAGTLTHAGNVAGGGALTKTGAGTLSLDGTNDYTGGTQVNAGVVEIDADANLGAAAGPLSFAGGTLRNTADTAMARATTLDAGGGTFETAAGTQLTQDGVISGAGGLAKAGAGTMVLTGAAGHTGGTTIGAGTLQLGDGGTTGSLTGNVLDNGALVFDRANLLDVAGVISGTGSVTQSGTGITRLLGDNLYAGPTTVESGALYVNGDQAAATGVTTAAAGSTLGGDGTIGGDVTIADGATLAPGDVGAAPGTLTIAGTLALEGASVLDYSFGQANVPGGPLNDRTLVGGDLVLDGTLNVTTTPGGAFGPGVYRVFDYGGALTDNGLTIGTIPAPEFHVQTSVANQVNLVNTTGLTLNFWDGGAGPKNNGAVNGGDGTWQNSDGNDNWTETSGLANAPFSDGSFAIFTGTPGTVTVDNGFGAVTVSGMQYAVDGYLVEGGPITLTGAPESIVRVGDGTGAGAVMTVTISAELTGASGLAKTRFGTLVLAGANSYTGGTAIDGGVLQIAEDDSLGGGDLSFDGGTLRSTASFTLPRGTMLEAGGGTIETTAGTLDYTGVVGGPGALTKTGTGTLVLDAANSYAGGTAINGGILEAAADASLGAAAGSLSFDGGAFRPAASFAMARDTTLNAGGGTIATLAGITLTQAGDIAGSGALAKAGAGTFVLTGTGTATGGTTIAAGILQLGDGGTTGSLAGDITDNGVLAFDRSDALTVAGTISGTGIVRQQGPGTTTLAGTNSYAGGTEVLGGTLDIAADANLGAAPGPVTIDGGTLRNTAPLTTQRTTTLGAAGGTLDTAATLLHAGAIGGAGALSKTGAGALVLSGTNSYAGATALDVGALYVDGDQSAATGATTAASGTTLGGTGAIGGDVSIADGATLSPGAIGAVPGTLSIAGSLGLGAGSTLDYGFGQANATGGALNDLTRVAGDLILDGTLDVTTTPGGSFDPGIYRVISYGGSLTDNGLGIGTIPAPGFSVQTSIASQVNLVNTTGVTLNYWDGASGPKNDGVIDGGDGTWQNVAGNDNWTEATGAVNAPFTDGAFAIFTGAAGEVTVDNSLGAVTVSGMQFATDGYLVAGDLITLAGASDAIVRVGDGTADSAAMTATIAAELTGASQLTKTDLGTLVLSGANSYSGGTAIDGGVLEIASDANLGAATGALSFDSGTLRVTSDVTVARATSLEAGGGTLETGADVTLTQASGVTGAGALGKTGAGTVLMTGDSSFTGGTTIVAGTLQLGDGGTSGSIVGDVANDGVLVVDRSDALALAGSISGAGIVRQQGSGTTTLGGTNSYAGGTEILGGTLEIAADANLGTAAGPLTINGGTLRTTGSVVTERTTTLGAGGGTLDAAAALLHTGTIGGAGALAKTGAGTLVLTGANSYAGATAVEAGALYVNGDQTAATGATAAASGSTLGGAGTIGGDVTVAGGATLAPGAAGGVPGTLGITGSLGLAAGSTLDYSFGQANVAGGALNDLTEVAGDLALDGTLNVATTPGGSFDPGIYRVISYGGALTDNGLAIGTIPSPAFFVQTSVANQVNLVNTAGLTLSYWDGDAGPKDDGTIDGGDGSWQNAAGNDWTEATGAINAPWTDRGFAVFMGAAGDVTVDDSLGAVSASGMQFVTDGYTVAGDAITFAGVPDAIVRVGDGTAAGAAVTATIAAELTGAAQLTKTDLGTLVLSGANSYTGGTAIDGGTLEIASDASLGAAGGALSLDSGTLRTTADLAMTRATALGSGGGTFETAAGTTLAQQSGITGDGALTKAGAGTLVMAGVGSYLGGTAIAGGTLQLGDGGTSGSVVGDVANEGALVFDRSDGLELSGDISGTGTVRQQGSGTTVLGGANSYSGSTTVAAGTLEAGAANAFSPGSAHAVAAAGTLDLADFDQTVAGLSNAGRVSLGQISGTRLTVEGDYVGQGGILHFTADLGGDASATDLMTVEGSTSGTGVIEVTNAAGIGAQTVNGIKLIDIGGASNAAFSLDGDTVLDGRPVVIGGAFAYSLWKGGVSTPTDGDWYLRSQSTIQTGPPQLQPGVPVYEAYPRALLALNGLPTMQERIGNRYWNDAGNPAALAGQIADGNTQLPSGGLVEDRRAWARVEGSHARLQPDTEFGDQPDYDLDIWKLQVGIDRPVRETDGGVLFAGLTFNYGTVGTEVSSPDGDGSIDTDGYGFGGSLTWLGDDDLYLDGQAQLMWYDSDLSSDAVDDDLASGNDGFGYAVGVEAGKRVPFRPTWTVTPQAQVVYSSVDFDSFIDPFDAPVSAEEGAALPVRLGVSIDQENAWKGEQRGDLRRTHFYGIANLYYDLIGNTKVSVGGTGLTSDGDQAWGSLGVGGTYTWNDGAYGVYAEGLVGTSLSDFGSSYANSATVGLRIAW